MQKTKVRMILMKPHYHFKKEDVKPNDIFYAEHYDYNGNKVGHYFYCVYSQINDKDNNLFRDVIGLLITTKDVPGRNVNVKINGKQAYVCCDNELRFIAEVGKVQNKHINLTSKEKKNVMRSYKKMNKEKEKQMKVGFKRNE